MSKLTIWWQNRSPAEKTVIGVAAGVAAVATGGAVAYAIAADGAIVVVGTTVVAVGKAAKVLAKAKRG